MREVSIKNTNLSYDYNALSARTKTDMVVIHHTGNPDDDDCSAKQINASHQGQGWACIGYHYVIRKDGTIEQGRPHWTVGAHAYGDNGHTIGVHLCGNFEIGKPTPEQIEAVSLLTAKICEDYGLPVDTEHVVGHCELRGDTACPGKNLHAILQTIRGKAIWYQQN